MNTIGFVQFYNGEIFELVDEVSYLPTEEHARICDKYHPGEFFRVLDRSNGASGVFDTKNVKLVFRFKKKNY